MNPHKSHTGVAPPARVTAVVVSCVPADSGYYEQALDVLRLCLASMREHADEPIDILVVDNASCPEVGAFLSGELEAGRVQYLLLNARNIGVGNAMLRGMRAAPGEIIAYSDSDIYYQPGWLRPLLEVVEKFPKVGVVSGVPQRGLTDYEADATMSWAEASDRVAIERGQFLEREWLVAFNRSVGVLGESEDGGDNPRFQALLAEEDVRLSHAGARALIGAGHLQFLMPREALREVPEQWSERYMRCKRELLDGPLAAAGLLRLSSERAVAYHIGNDISEPWLRAEYERLVGGEAFVGAEDGARSGQSPHARGRLSQRVWRQRHVRRVMQGIYSWAFDRYVAGGG